MSKRISLSACFILVTAVFLAALFTSGKAGGAYPIFLALPVLMLAEFFIEERGAINSLALYSSALAALLAFICRPCLVDMALAAASFWTGCCGVRAAKDVAGRIANMREAEFNAKKASYDSVSSDLERVEDERMMLDNQVLDIGRLYDISKKMSQSLKFGEIFHILAQFIMENFEISRMGLILMDYEKHKPADENPPIKTVYEVDKGGNISEIQGEGLPAYERAVRHVFEGKGAFPGEETVVPLVVERRTLAILTAADLKKEDHEKFLILAGQFTLQLKRVALYEHVEALSITDSLTGCYRRSYFEKRLSEELERSERLGLDCSLVILDIDHFKNCNDTFGHLVGDVALREIAATIKKNIREVDLLARYGGEEFSVMLPETGAEGALHVAERIREAVCQNEISAYDEVFRLAVSAGISSFPRDPGEMDELIDRADRALYRAKETGRNKVVAWGG